MTLIDLFREFSSVSTRENYSPSSRILYYTLLWCWNEQRRPEITTMTTKQLYTLTGLPETTFREAFTYLADRGWVKRVKSRKRGLIAWLMRDRRESAAPPAGFLMSPAQRKSDKSLEESPCGDSSRTQPKVSEVRANVRTNSLPTNTRTASQTTTAEGTVSAEPRPNAEVYERDFEADVPELEM